METIRAFMETILAFMETVYKGMHFCAESDGYIAKKVAIILYESYAIRGVKIMSS
jgi:hypothetical protein